MILINIFLMLNRVSVLSIEDSGKTHQVKVVNANDEIPQDKHSNCRQQGPSNIPDSTI